MIDEGLEDGSYWLRWNDETLDLFAERRRPIVVLVDDRDPAISARVRALRAAMSEHPRLCALMGNQFHGVFVDADAIPEHLAWLDAGTAFHLAVLSPIGWTPIATIDIMRDDTEALVDQIAQALTGLDGIWR
jgi:hypothetical protein